MHQSSLNSHKNKGHSPFFFPPIMRSSVGQCRNIRFRQLSASHVIITSDKYTDRVISLKLYRCTYIFFHHFYKYNSGEPGLVDKVLALHAGSRGFDSHRGHMSERFFRSNRPGYPHTVSSELEISGIRVAVGDCSVTERRRWRPPYQTGKTVHVHAKHY